MLFLTGEPSGSFKVIFLFIFLGEPKGGSGREKTGGASCVPACRCTNAQQRALNAGETCS